MRDSIAEIERITTILHSEINFDRGFLERLLEHKNSTIEWLRVQQEEETRRLSQTYDAMIDTISKEVELLERHLSTYEKGVPPNEQV